MSRSERGPDYGLQIFEKHPNADAYRVGAAYEPYSIVATEKRFTTAELMAEFHAARADLNEALTHPSGTYWTPLDVDEDNTKETAMKRATTFLHFASRNHHDE